MLTPHILETMDTSVLCWLATVDAQGQPNVSPKEVFAAVDAQHLVIAHIASPTSVRNLADNPRVCVSFINVFTQKGYKLLGEATAIPPTDPRFVQLEPLLLNMTHGKFPIRAAMLVRVSAVEPILAPSYGLFPEDTTEASQVASAMHTYGVERLTSPQPTDDASRRGTIIDASVLTGASRAAAPDKRAVDANTVATPHSLTP